MTPLDWQDWTFLAGLGLILGAGAVALLDALWNRGRAGLPWRLSVWLARASVAFTALWMVWVIAGVFVSDGE